MLSDDSIMVYAISGKDFGKNYNKKNIVFKDVAKVKIEIWNRRPALIIKNSINPIDIYLVLNNSSDERVQIELESLLKEYDLKI